MWKRSLKIWNAYITYTFIIYSNNVWGGYAICRSMSVSMTGSHVTEKPSRTQRLEDKNICIWHSLECEMSFSSPNIWIQPESERRGLDLDTSAEKTHLARQSSYKYVPKETCERANVYTDMIIMVFSSSLQTVTEVIHQHLKSTNISMQLCNWLYIVWVLGRFWCGNDKYYVL